MRVSIAAGGTLVWLPEPVIVAAGAHHVTDVRIELAEDARLVLREEVLLGRHGETGGRIEQRLRVSRAVVCATTRRSPSARRTRRPPP